MAAAVGEASLCVVWWAVGSAVVSVAVATTRRKGAIQNETVLVTKRRAKLSVDTREGDGSGVMRDTGDGDCLGRSIPRTAMVQVTLGNKNPKPTMSRG
jgi:hypothetical protein